MFGFAFGTSTPPFRPSPALQLTFAGATTLDSRITFARADAVTCATYFDSTGRLQTATANTPRFDYDPATAAGVTGGDVVSNGAFSNSGTGWATAAWTFSNGQASLVGNGTVQTLQQGCLTLGKTYFVTYTVVSISGGSVCVQDEQTGVPVAALTANTPGTYSGYVTGSGSGNLSFKRASGSINVTIDNVSAREVTFTPRGLLIEESRQNLLLHSRDMTQAAWTKTDVTPARTQVGLDGVANTACLMTEGSAGTALTAQSVTVTAGSTLSGSMVLKRGNTDWVRVVTQDSTGTNGAQCWFNLATGAKGTTAGQGAGSSFSASITSLGGGWYRCAVTVIPDGTSTSVRLVVLSATADSSTTRVANATYIVDCAQLEVGAFATSPIITAGTSLTRAADSASMTGTNVSSWYSASGVGTYVGEFSFPSAPTGNTALIGTSSRPTLALGATYVKGSYPGVVDVATMSVTVTTNVVHKAAFAFNTGDYAVTLNGAAPTTSTNAQAVAVPTNLAIGNEARFLNGWIRSLRYYPTRLPNATLQALTA